jgi:hypothetical protein
MQRSNWRAPAFITGRAFRGSAPPALLRTVGGALYELG